MMVVQDGTIVMAFSPDCEHLAVACKDGFLRVFKFSTRKLVVAFRSYFGGFTSVCWSPDGKYLLVRLLFFAFHFTFFPQLSP